MSNISEKEREDGEISEAEEGVELNDVSAVDQLLSRKQKYDAAPNGHWLVCGKTGAGKTTLVKKLILNGVMNKKNVFWFHSHPTSEYIADFKRDCKLKGVSVFGIVVYSYAKNQHFESVLKDTEKYWLGYRAKNKVVQEQKVDDPYFSCLFVFDDLFPQLMTSRAFLAHMTSVRQHGIQDVMLTQNFSGKDVFGTINMNVDNFLLMSLAGVPARLKSFLHEKSKFQSNQGQSSSSLNQIYRAMCVEREQVGKIHRNETDHVYVSCHTRSGDTPLSRVRTRLGNNDRHVCLIEKMNGTYEPIPSMRKSKKGSTSGGVFELVIGIENVFAVGENKNGQFQPEEIISEEVTDSADDVDSSAQSSEERGDLLDRDTLSNPNVATSIRTNTTADVPSKILRSSARSERVDGSGSRSDRKRRVDPRRRNGSGNGSNEKTFSTNARKERVRTRRTNAERYLRNKCQINGKKDASANFHSESQQNSKNDADSDGSFNDDSWKEYFM